ncbi:MAG: HEPN domain-containing protein [Candidatus Edwardsbacteria bacterium]
MTYNEEINYWLNAAAHDLDVAETLFKNSKYDWCLFIAHLVLEKTLKAFYVRDNQKMPPPIHKLDILASNTKLSLSDEQVKFLKKVNEFNLEARYSDKKFSFYKLCTKTFTKKYFTDIKRFYRWLLEQIK